MCPKPAISRARRASFKDAVPSEVLADVQAKIKALLGL
jgi:hypothetical protein